MTQQPATNRKRAAPGASPMVQQSSAPQAQMPYQQLSDNADFSTFDFSNPFTADQSFPDAAFADALNVPDNVTFTANAAPSSSTDLVRRARNQHGILGDGQQEQWSGIANLSGQSQEEDEEDLDMKVAMAKRDAQGKRKQIPPFVQKLSSFLDSGNTSLIRWSDDGRSFIVLDEDEFARTLIPELFKHSNYASFVRQLNMYGFHKTVNITDGSLRQSEKARKGVKPPSMYSHPYFRKNRPDLLWLIQKPAGKSNAKRKREGGDSDDDSPGPDGRHHGDAGGNGHSDLAPVPRNEMASMRQELKKLQQQQELISRMITHIKNQNEQFYRQATAFQALHDRHENSINAILTFLATFYNRSLEGHAGQNLVNMFSNQAQNNQTHGSVVGEYQETTPSASNQVQRFVKRPQLLLGGPIGAASNAAAPNSTRQSTTPIPPRSTSVKHESRGSSAVSQLGAGRNSDSPPVKTDASTPNVLDSVPESDQMMSVINSVNATNASDASTAAPSFDFSSALDHYQNANGNSPLTPQQRDDMLALIANQHGGDASSNNNNALVSPTPPAIPDLNRFKESQQQLEMLTNMQKQQDARVQAFQRRLQPLSPTGSIPGIAGSDPVNPFDVSGADYDPNAFLNFDNWNDGNLGNDGTDFNFNTFDTDNNNTNGDFNWNDYDDPTTADAMFQTNNQGLGEDGQFANKDGGGKVESVSSEVTTPQANGSGNAEDGDSAGDADKAKNVSASGGSTKRQRRE